MTNTVNVSLTPMQRAWLENRRETGGYTSTSDVVQDLIRQAQDAEHEKLRKEFDDLVANSPGSSDPEPVDLVVKASRLVKRRRHLARRNA